MIDYRSSGFCQATSFGNACPQQNYTLPYIAGLNYTALATFISKANASEDCTWALVYLSVGTNPNKSHNAPGLYANLFRPAGATEQSKLPVVVVSTRVTPNDGTMASEVFLPVVLRRGFRNW